MLISKRQTCLSDKNAPKKDKIKKRNKMGLSKIRKRFIHLNLIKLQVLEKSSSSLVKKN